MKKRKMHITLITGDLSEDYNVLGEYDEKEDKIIYQESKNLLTDVEIDLKNQILIRSNKDYFLKYNLKEKSITENMIHIKDLNKIITLKIRTEKFTKTKTQVEIIYTILDGDEKIHYIVEF